MVISSAKMVIQLARNAGLRSNDGDLMGIDEWVHEISLDFLWDFHDHLVLRIHIGFS